MLPIRLLVAACGCLAVFGCNLSLLTPLLTLTLQERGESAIAIGWIGVATGAGILCAPAFTSRLAARMGSFRCLAASLVFYGFATAAHKLTEDSLAAWIALRFFSAAAATFVFVISEAAIVRAAPAERRGFILGVYGLGFGGGFALGPVVLSVVGIHGWSPYLTAVALTAAVLAVAYPARRDFPDFVDSARPAMFAKIARACPLAFACAFAAGAVENTLGDLLPPYGRRLGMEVAAAALLLTSFGLGSIAQVADRRACRSRRGAAGGVVVRRVVDDCGGGFDLGGGLVVAGTRGGGDFGRRGDGRVSGRLGDFGRAAARGLAAGGQRAFCFLLWRGGDVGAVARRRGDGALATTLRIRARARGGRGFVFACAFGGARRQARMKLKSAADKPI